MLVSHVRQSSPEKLTVTFEDGSEVKTTLGVVTEKRIYSGCQLSEDEIFQFKRASSRALARERALELISRRSMSRSELVKKLKAKGEDEDAADFSADWLEDNGFLDDQSYSFAVARHYTAKGFGAGRIRAELSKRGVDRELWDEALESVSDSTEKLDKYISAHLPDPADREQARKVAAALYRRGFGWDEIRQALNRRGEDTFED